MISRLSLQQMIQYALQHSLRLRVVGFLLLISALVGSYLMLFWLPQYQLSSLDQRKQQVQEHLTTLSDALLPYLIQGQFAAVHETLDALLDRQPDWRQLSLQTDEGRRLYPLFPQLPASGPNLLQLRQEIRFHDQHYADLLLTLDATQLLAEIQQRNLHLAGIFIALLLIAFLFVALFLEAVVGYPIRLLSRASERLAGGDYNAKLPNTRLDEVGDLVQQFNQMRHIIQHKENSLIKARRAAEAANRAKSCFLANMSHEVRTPMNGVVGMLELLSYTPLNTEQQEYLQTALDSANIQIRVLNNLLDFSRLEAGQLQLEQVPFQPVELLDKSLQNFRQEVDNKGLRLNAQLDPVLRKPLLGDPLRLQEMINNLVSNAIKFTHQGEVSLSWYQASNPDMMEFSVTDSGIGISADAQSNLFQPFTQADDSSTRQFGGTGLGLAIVQRYARLMSGEVGVESTPGHGTRFWFQIPMLPSEPTPTHLPPSGGAGYYSAGNGEILVAEDNPINLVVVEAILKKQGLSFRSVANGKEALKIATRKQRPLLILMDCQMPLMSGLEATREIRRWEARHHCQRVPIIALTASAFEEDRLNAQQAGMDSFLPKPIRMKNLLPELAKWLSVQKPPITS